MTALNFQNPGFSFQLYPPGTSQDLIADAIESDIGTPSLGGTDLFSAILQSIDITMQAGAVTMAEVILAPPLDVARKILASAFIQPGCVMALKIGYADVGQATETFILYIPNVPGVKFGLQTTISFKGTGFLYNALRLQRDQVWATSTGDALFVIEAIADDYGLDVVHQLSESGPVLFPKKLRGAEAEAIWTDDIHQIGSDWDMVRRICEAGDADFIVYGTNLIVVDYELKKQQEGVAEFRMFNQMGFIPTITPPAYVYPIEVFDVVSMNPYGGAAIEAVNTTGHDANKNDSQTPDTTLNLAQSDTTHASKDANEGPGALSGQVLTIAGSGTARPEPKINPVTQTGEVFRDVAKKVFSEEWRREVKESAYLVGVQANLTTPGNPTVMPLNMVNVSGLGPAFDGPYEVLTVHHRIESSGFKTKLALRRNSIGNMTGVADTAPQTLSGSAAILRNTEVASPIAPDVAETDGGGSVNVPATPVS